MAKRWTTSLVSVSVRMLKFADLARGGEGHGTLNENGRAIASVSIDRHMFRIRYTCTGDGVQRDIDQSVRLTWTPCHYGGERVWFQCPECGRRCGVLYLSWRVACRHCFDMVYPCQGDRDRRGWSLYHRWHMDRRPRGMHWVTYEKRNLKAERRCLAILLPLVQKWGMKIG